MTKYGIYYTDTLGFRRLYMRAVFDTRSEAEEELALIKKEKKKGLLHQVLVSKSVTPSEIRNGENFRIKKIKVSK